ncbi:hypothetical protein MMAD_05160 [Mycolicibacterium madagascariense]|uniref:Uncharacterized protein n=1 Tax=Mycolicibacterium madagascariense TaxID=212765 RepID=A0A7I7XC71_9MYCO|nr:hypothetical protein MMAD_05160 [Mycolicibacterium madagascariense]
MTLPAVSVPTCATGRAYPGLGTHLRSVKSHARHLPDNGMALLIDAVCMVAGDAEAIAGAPSEVVRTSAATAAGVNLLMG